MSFSGSELRLGMDVFSADGVLLGSVVHIRRRPRAVPSMARQPLERAAMSAFSGEALGPMPTAALGNGGPDHQRRDVQYATLTHSDSSRRDSEPAAILVFRTMVHLDWRSLWPRLRSYPVSLVQNISLERIVLAGTAADLEGR